MASPGGAGLPASRAKPDWLVAVAPLDDAKPNTREALPSVPVIGTSSIPAETKPRQAAGPVRNGTPETVAALPVRPAAATLPVGVTTLLIRVGAGVLLIDDLNGRKVAIDDRDMAHREAIAATFRSLSLEPDLVVLSTEMADKRLKSGEVAAVVALADEAMAAKANATTIKVRIDPYVARSREPSLPPRQN